MDKRSVQIYISLYCTFSHPTFPSSFSSTVIFALQQFTALTAATLSDFHSFSSQLLRCLKAEVLVHGNASEEEAKRLTSSVREILQFLPLPPSQEPIRRSVALEPVQTNPILSNFPNPCIIC